MPLNSEQTSNSLSITRDNSLSRILGQAILLGLTLHVLDLVVFIVLSSHPLAAASVFSIVLYVFLYIMNRRGHMYAAYILVCLDILAYQSLLVMFTGWDTGNHYIMMFIVPTLFYPPRFSMSFRVAAASFICLVYCGLYYFSHRYEPVYQLPENIIQLLNYANMFLALLVLAVLSYIMNDAMGNIENRLRSMNEELAFLARVDPLTRIWNRRSMDQYISITLKKPRKAGSQTVFILSDIDHFKRVNDNCGHACGDMVLKKVSGVMADAVREGDRVARWGGEEFLVMITHGSLDGAMILAERIRKAVADAKMTWNGGDISVTMTFGIGVMEKDEGADSCIGRADRALYYGKNTGRNRVVAWTPEIDRLPMPAQTTSEVSG